MAGAVIFPLFIMLAYVGMIAYGLFRFTESDTLKYDLENVWVNFPITPKDIRIKR